MNKTTHGSHNKLHTFFAQYATIAMHRSIRTSTHLNVTFSSNGLVCFVGSHGISGKMMDNVNIENRIISICSNYFMVGFCWDTAKLYRYVHAIDIHHNLKFKVQSNLCLATEQNAFHTNNNYQFQTGKHYQINFYHKNFAPVQSGCDIIWDACTKPHLWLREVKENLRHSRLWLWFLLRWLLSES